MSKQQYTVTFIRRGKTEQEQATVSVEDNGEGQLYATHLGLWGCGKNSSTPEGAIRLLVQDMATIVSIARLTA